MGRKAGAAAKANSKRHGASTSAAEPQRGPHLKVVIAFCVAAAAVVVAFLWHQFSSVESGDAMGSSRVAKLLANGEAFLQQGYVAKGIDELVAAQRLDLSSEGPARILGSFDNRLGNKGPHHLKTAVRAGIERLEKVLYEEMHRQGDLQDWGLQLRLAKLQLRYHPSDILSEAVAEVEDANRLLKTLATPGIAPDATSAASAASCSFVASLQTEIVKHRALLTEQLKKGFSAKELAKELLPSKPFVSVDRRANLSIHEYIREYVEKRRPVIITDYANNLLPGHSNFSWEHMRTECGDMDVYLSQRLSEARHLWAGLGHASGKRPLSSWLDEITSGQASHDTYLMDWGLAGRCDSFLQKFAIPKYFAGDLWKRLPFNSSSARDFFGRHPSLFAGPAGSGGTLHVDSYASTFWQFLLHGRKRWTLYALPDKLRRTLLYAGVEHEIMPLVPPPGGIALGGDMLPLLDVAEEFKVQVEVGPGELMVVPHDVPHAVENIEPIMAISMNILDHVAVQRLREDLQARSCFSEDGAITANLRVLDEAAFPVPSEVDVPFSEYRTYGNV